MSSYQSSDPVPLPSSVVSSIKQVLHKLRAAGECPINWRVFSARYRSMTRTELVPSLYGHTSVLSMLEFMAECGQCEMFNRQDKGVCVTSKKVTLGMGEIDLSMLDMPWSETGLLPVGAVEGESLEQQQVDDGVREGAVLRLQVTEVVTLDNMWFCLLEMVEKRDKVMEELDHFYTKGEGRKWLVPTGGHCWAGRMMVAPYKTEGFHRVMVKRMLKSEMVSVLYVDFGTLDKVRLKDIRLLQKRFLSLPAQAIAGRLWGVKEVEGKEVEAKRRLVELASEGNKLSGTIGVVMAGVRVGVRDRRRDGAVETGGRMALWLIDVAGDGPEGELVNEQLVKEGFADWLVKDLNRFIKKKMKTKKILNRRSKHSATDLVLSVVDELETALVKNYVEEVEIDDENLQHPQLTLKENLQHPQLTSKIKIITVDNSSSEDEEYQEMKKILIKPPSQPKQTTASKLTDATSELFYGPPPLVSPQGVLLRYSDYGWSKVEQVDLMPMGENILAFTEENKLLSMTKLLAPSLEICRGKATLPN